MSEMLDKVCGEAQPKSGGSFVLELGQRGWCDTVLYMLWSSRTFILVPR